MKNGATFIMRGVWITGKVGIHLPGPQTGKLSL